MSCCGPCMICTHIDVLMQDCSISIANALEILQPGIQPSICSFIYEEKMCHITELLSSWSLSCLNDNLRATGCDKFDMMITPGFWCMYISMFIYPLLSIMQGGWLVVGALYLVTGDRYEPFGRNLIKNLLNARTDPLSQRPMVYHEIARGNSNRVFQDYQIWYSYLTENKPTEIRHNVHI